MVGVEFGQHPVDQCGKVGVAERGGRDAGHTNEKFSPAVDVKEAGDLACNGGHLIAGGCPVGAMTALALEHPGQPILSIVVGQHRR